jgi:hypothetical protein
LSSASLLAPGLLHLDACPAPLDACPTPPGCLACSFWSACSAPPRVLALLLMVLSDHVGWGFGVVGVWAWSAEFLLDGDVLGMLVWLWCWCLLAKQAEHRIVPIYTALNPWWCRQHTGHACVCEQYACLLSPRRSRSLASWSGWR